LPLGYPLVQASQSSVPLDPLRIRNIAGFWRRVLAFALDTVIIGTPCGILGFVFRGYFSSAQRSGIWIGFIITFVYFAVLGSSLGGGQTLGHRITQIRVVDRSHQVISLSQSCCRYALLLLPLLLTPAVLPASSGYWVKSGFDWILSSGVTILLYLYVFNRRTRQSLHDLATDSFVVDAHPVREENFARIWPWHWAILAGIGVTSVLVSIFFLNSFGAMKLFPELAAIQQAILDSGEVQDVGVFTQKTWNNGVTTSRLSITVTWKGKPPDTEKAASEIVAIALQADPSAMNRDFISVGFNEGFKIGFATFSTHRFAVHSPAHWTNQIQDR